MIYSDNYLPSDQDFEELLHVLAASGKEGKVHFFNPKNEVDAVAGVFSGVEKNGYERWLIVDRAKVRIDKIITVLGRPGPAYDYYNSFANACLACEDLDQF